MTAASSHARAHLIEFDLNAEDGCRAREWAVRLEFPPGGRGDAGESDVAGQALDVIYAAGAFNVAIKALIDETRPRPKGQSPVGGGEIRQVR